MVPCLFVCVCVHTQVLSFLQEANITAIVPTKRSCNLMFFRAKICFSDNISCVLLRNKYP